LPTTTSSQKIECRERMHFLPTVYDHPLSAYLFMFFI
jgi:hypothetical protein